jgi:hypothetical protein
MVSKNTSAQVMLEYVVIAIIVMTAIMFGGPFLVNSIGARFHGMDNTRGDSFNEHIKLAAMESCICNPPSNNPANWPPVGMCAPVGCGVLEKKSSRECAPGGCNVTQGCVQDSACCLASVPGGCGIVVEGGALPMGPNGESTNNEGSTPGSEVSGLARAAASGMARGALGTGDENENGSGGGETDGDIIDPGHEEEAIPNLCATRETLPQIPEMQPPFPAGMEGRCLDTGGAVRGCKVGERAYSATCGKSFTRFACKTDPTCVSLPVDPNEL